MQRGLIAACSLAWSLAAIALIPDLAQTYLVVSEAERFRIDAERLILHSEPEPESDSEEAVALAMTVLLRASHFRSAATGFGPGVPPEVRAWLVIARAPDAIERFRDLSRSSNLATAAFGAAGLAHASPEDLRLLREVRATEERALVPTSSGCVLADRPLGELLSEIAAGKWWRGYFGISHTGAAT